jgi:TP53 regulating kinase-like protein
MPGPTPPVELTKYGTLLSQGAEARVWLITLPSSSSSSSTPSNNNGDNNTDDDDSTEKKHHKSLHVGAGLHVPQLSSFVHPSSLLLLGGGQQLQSQGEQQQQQQQQQHPLRQVICKERFTKKYRHPQLDATITKSRTKSEARSLLRCQKAGIPCPNVLAIANWSTSTTTASTNNTANECLDTSSTTSTSSCLYLEYIQGCTVRQYFEQQSCEQDGCIKTIIDTQTLHVAYNIGTLVAKMHSTGVIHGDLTTSNIMLGNPPSPDGGEVMRNDNDKPKNEMSDYEERNNNNWKPQLLLIDFGLATSTNNSTSSNQHKQQNNAEEKAVDLYVLERAFLSTHPESEMLVEEVWKGYCSYYEKRLDCDTRTDHDNAGSAIASSSDVHAANAVMNRLEQVRMRGRKRECFG